MPELKKDARGDLVNAIEQVELTTKTDADFNEMLKRFTGAPVVKKFEEVFTFISYLNNVNDVTNFKIGVDTVISFRTKASGYGQGLTDEITNALEELKAKKTASKKSAGTNAKAIKEEIVYLDVKMK